MEGEYYISPDKERIYLYTDKNICNSVIQVSVMQDPLVMLCGVENICFDGIIFENSRGSGAYIEGGKNCVFKNCTFRNLGMVGVQVGQGATPLPEGRHTAHGEWAEDLAKPENMSGMPGCWQEMLYRYAAWNNNGGKNNGLQSCTIYNTGAGGVLLGGGDRKTLTAAGNYVENCEIFNVNRLDKSYRAGIDISGVGNKISHCDMYDMTGFAILIHGNDHIIEYNKIHDVIKNVADAGAIYMGRDLSEVGNKIQYNFIYDLVGNVDSAMGVCAVYFDDYCSFNEVYGNYFYNIRQNYDSNSFGVVFWNRGGQTSVANNIFIDCPVYIRPMLNGADGLHDILRNPGNKSEQLIADRATAKEDDYTGVDITSEVYRNKYPYLFAVYNGTYKNALMYWNNPVIYGKKDCFVNPEELNFTVKPDSDRFKQIEMVNVVDVIRNVNNEHKKFEVVDFGKIGPQKEHR